jgi:hypothetical protein
MHISQLLKLGGGKVLSNSGMHTFYKSRKERVGYWDLYGLLVINNPISRNSYRKAVKASYKSLMMKVMGKEALILCYFHICSIKELTVTMISGIITKSALKAVLTLSQFHCIKGNKIAEKIITNEISL